MSSYSIHWGLVNVESTLCQSTFSTHLCMKLGTLRMAFLTVHPHLFLQPLLSYLCETSYYVFLNLSILISFVHGWIEASVTQSGNTAKPLGFRSELAGFYPVRLWSYLPLENLFFQFYAPTVCSLTSSVRSELRCLTVITPVCFFFFWKLNQWENY